mmetsp:Transcript_69751/g.149251  ORF Transcript_69751/g.149251 Transcript_69751/m.149251 type:complete len:235 (-) Transcript_69751:1912-2616(-)
MEGGTLPRSRGYLCCGALQALGTRGQRRCAGQSARVGAPSSARAAQEQPVRLGAAAGGGRLGDRLQNGHTSRWDLLRWRGDYAQPSGRFAMCACCNHRLDWPLAGRQITRDRSRAHRRVPKGSQCATRRYLNSRTSRRIQGCMRGLAPQGRWPHRGGRQFGATRPRGASTGPSCGSGSCGTRSAHTAVVPGDDCSLGRSGQRAWMRRCWSARLVESTSGYPGHEDICRLDADNI